MDHDERLRIAEQVTRARLSAGWSKEEAARRAGISPITLRRVEDGLPVQDVKMAAVRAMAREAERPADERQRFEQERATAERARSEDYLRGVEERMVRYRATDTDDEREEEERRRAMERTAREQARLLRMGSSPWPEGTDPDSLDSLLQARSMLWDYLGTIRGLVGEAKARVRQMAELEELIQGQWELVMYRLRQVDPELKSVTSLSPAARIELWREERYLALAATPEQQPLPDSIDERLPEDVITAARTALNISRATRDQASQTDARRDEDAR